MAKRIGAGFNRMWYGVVNSDGKFIGGTTTEPTEGSATSTGMLQLDGARTLPVGIPEPTNVPVEGDDSTLVNFEFDSADLPSGTFEMAVRNNIFEALAQGTKVQTMGTLELGTLDPSQRASQSLCFLLSRRSKKWEAGVKGAKAWENLYIPQATVKPLYTSLEQKSFSAYQYSMSLSKSDRTGWSTVSESLHGTCEASMFPIDSDYPLYMQAWRGDNAALTYTSTIAAISAAKTYMFVNDLQQTATTDYTLSGFDYLFASAPATSADIVALIEYDESSC